MNSLPLPLAHVLADEDARLFGDPGPRERRWHLREEEIVDARVLAQKLATRLENPPERISRWREESSHAAEYRKEIADEINALLESIAPDRWLHEHAAFGDADREPYSELRVASSFDPDEVFNLNRQMFDQLFVHEVRAAADLRFAELIAHIHERARNGKPRSALAISGGGIRSATYALGVLQALAQRHVLEKFDFLSTISGGGYIGAWLSSWVRRDPWGIRGVSAMLSSTPSDPLQPEPVPLRHLRAFSNYLIPRLSLFSADTWALTATYLRNLLLNWVVLIPLLVGLVGIPRVIFTAVVRDPRGSVTLDVASRGAVVGFVVGLLLLSFGFAVLIRYRPVVESSKTKNLTDGRFVRWCLIPLLGSSIAFVLAWAWSVSSGGNQPGLIAFLGATLLATTVGFFVFLWRYLRSPFAERAMTAKAREKRQWERIVAELIGALTAGTAGGLLIWLVATYAFPEPVEAVSLVGAVRWPIPDPGGLYAITAAYVCLGVPLLLGVLFVQAAIFVGATSHLNHDFDREWWARASGWVLLAALGWIGLSAIAIFGPIAIYHLPGALSAVGGTAGIFSVLVGKSGRTKGGAEAEESTASKATGIGLAIAIPIFVLYILALISLGTTHAIAAALDFQGQSSSDVNREIRTAERATREYDTTLAGSAAKVKEAPLSNPERVRSYEHLKIVETTPWGIALAIALGCPLLALLVSRCIGVNVFSMHAMYRNRLVRAYLGASRWIREPNRFTGFDPDDNLGMHDLRPEYLWWHSFRDIDHAIGLLANGRTPRLQLLAAELRRDLGDHLDELLNPETERRVARPALYHSLNTLIATRDLARLHDPSVGPAPESLRPLRNRRFIEVAFDDGQVYPVPMPLVCEQDIVVDDAAFQAAFAPGASAAADALRKCVAHPECPLRDAINDVLTDSSLKDLPAFAQSADATPFRFSSIDPIHRMIDNRLRLEAAFPGIFDSLQLPRPLHLVGICLNLTGGEELAWQERKGESFSVTPLASGCHRLGYRDSRHYGEISVGTAVTISGAAASPNMGYHSSPPLAFLMTLFNVRLGWWLGNPGLAGNDTYHRRNPKVSLEPLIRELTGNANDKYNYVYLSDGGHFENLGLYEMVLRRVHHIVVSDGTGDEKFSYGDLGNAIRKIRIDLGIEIEIKEISILPPTENGPGKYCAYGDIHYATVDGPNALPGKLLYIKPVVYRNEGPRDVLNYARNSTTFPHESTADQFFSESQFESYRRLGLFTVEQICRDRGADPMKDVDDFIETAKKYLRPVEPTDLI